jgi:ubiquinol-cytochrome c reductase iron-sulfur subunit
MARAKDALLSGLVLLASRGKRRRHVDKDPTRVVPDMDVDRGAETWAILLLFLSALAFLAFVVVYAVDSIPHQTQFLGLAIGLGLVLLATSLIVTALRLVVTEELVEEYPPQEHPGEVDLIASSVEEAGSRLTRARLFKLGLLAAGGGLATAALTPALSFGPLLSVKEYFGTPWRRGRRLVDEQGKPYRADDIEEKAFYTAFAENADKEELGASLVVVRLPKSALNLPAELAGYDADGIVAYSKICTHAGCAIAMYRVPTFAPDEPRPALVCPCHYSTFDPASGGTVTFGPAGRPLPMLPLSVDSRGFLRAKGNFNQAVGPSWWGVRNRKPNP